MQSSASGGMCRQRLKEPYGKAQKQAAQDGQEIAVARASSLQDAVAIARSMASPAGIRLCFRLLVQVMTCFPTLKSEADCLRP